MIYLKIGVYLFIFTLSMLWVKMGACSSSNELADTTDYIDTIYAHICQYIDNFHWISNIPTNIKGTKIVTLLNDGTPL